MNLNFKNPFILFGIIVIVFAGYWVFNGAIPNKTPDLSENKPNIVKNDTSQKPGALSWIENPNDAQTTYQAPLENLTSKFSENISSDFISKIDFSQAQDSPDNLLEQLNKADLSDTKNLSFLSNNPLGFLSSISDKDIKISSDNSSDKAAEYLLKYTAIVSQIAGSGSETPEDLLNEIISAMQNQDQREMSQMAISLSNGFNEMTKLEVPSGLVALHKENLMILKNSAIIFNSLAYQDSDPLRAYMAVANGSELLTKGANKASVLFEEASKKYSL